MKEEKCSSTENGRSRASGGMSGKFVRSDNERIKFECNV